MTASKGIWKRYVCAAIDQTPRTVPQWAKTLHTTKHIIRDRAKRMGGDVAAAIDAIRTGTAPQVFCPKLTKGVCKRGHKIEGDNILMVCDSNTGWKEVERCRKCYRKGPAIRIGEKRPGNQKPRDMCNAGLHRLEGDNVITVTLKSGRIKRRCRACNNQYQRRRARELKMGTTTVPLVRPGQSIEERIAALSAPEPNGCVLWRGKVAHRVPWLNHKDFLPTSGKVVPLYLWERKHGPMQNGYTVRSSCGNPLCIADAHATKVSFRSLAHTPDVNKQRWATRRKRYAFRDLPREVEKKLPNKPPWYVEAQHYIREVRGSLASFRLGAELDDVIQKVFISVMTTDPAKITSLRGFMVISARRHAIDTKRRRWERDVMPTDDDEAIERAAHAYGDPVPDPFDALMAADQEEDDRIALKNRVNALPHQQRRVYLLRAGGLSNAGVAQRLGITVNTVENHIKRISKALRQSPTGRERRALLVPLDTSRHHYGLKFRRTGT